VTDTQQQPATANPRSQKTAYHVFLRLSQGAGDPNSLSADRGSHLPTWGLVGTNLTANNARQAVSLYTDKAKDTVKKGDVFVAVPSNRWKLVPIEAVETQTVVKLG
jgi:hypothetical protein